MSTNSPSKPTKLQNVRILSLDGGGIRGVAVARILQEIETHFNKPIHKLFDLVVGTSTGGLLSIMLTIPAQNNQVMTAKAVKELYIDQAKNIFLESEDYEITHMGVKYTQSGLVKMVDQIFGTNAGLKNARTHVGVCTTDEIHNKSILLNSFRAMKYSGDYRHSALLSNIAKSTSAAPTYFPHVNITNNIPTTPEITAIDAKVNNGKEANESACPLDESVEWYDMGPPTYKRQAIMLEDGGTSNNNPSYLGLKLIKHMLRNFNLKAKNIQVVSVGTGTLTGTEQDPEEGQAYWKDISSSDYGCVQRLLIHDPFKVELKAWEVHRKLVEHFQEKNQEGNYVRAQFKITEAQSNNMDDVTPANIDSLIQAAEGYLFTDTTKTTYSAKFLELLKVIETYAKNEGVFGMEEVKGDSTECSDFEEVDIQVEEEDKKHEEVDDGLARNERHGRSFWSSETLVTGLKYAVPVLLGVAFKLKN